MKTKKELVKMLIGEYIDEVVVSGMNPDAYVIMKTVEKINSKHELGLEDFINKIKEVVK